MINALTKVFPKRIPADRVTSAEANLAGLRARASAAAERRADAAKRLAEAKAALDAAAEAGEEMAPIAQRALAAEAELKAVDLEAGPLSAAVARAEAALADLREENRIAVLDAEADSMSEELAAVEAKAIETMKALAALVDRAFALRSAMEAVCYERDPGHQASHDVRFADVTWRQKLHDASRDRPLLIRPEDLSTSDYKGQKLALEMDITSPRFSAPMVRESRKAKAAA